jgi:hypothetical protein
MVVCVRYVFNSYIKNIILKKKKIIFFRFFPSYYIPSTPTPYPPLYIYIYLYRDLLVVLYFSWWRVRFKPLHNPSTTLHTKKKGYSLIFYFLFIFYFISIYYYHKIHHSSPYLYNFSLNLMLNDLN